MKEFYLILSKKSIVSGLLAVGTVLCMCAPVFAYTPSDPYYRWQKDVYNQIHAPEAWDYTVGSSTVVVAVIDTGVDILNSDLADNIWVNTDEVPNNGLDDDNNGYVDDVHGWNIVENNNDVSIANITEADDAGAVNHGTLLAGLIGASGDNEVLGAGLNWHVSIMPLRAVNNSGGGDLVDIARAVNYAVDNGASIINLSFVGFTTEPALTAALYRAYQKGVLVVAAAGNSRNDSSGNENLTKVKQYPICLDYDYAQNWVLGVASVSASDTLSYFGDYGSCIDISAPGEKIYSTQKVSEQPGFEKDFDGGWYGTSFAAPLVAGTAALIKSIRPEWAAKEIIETLLKSADDIDYLNPGFAGQLGYGRLNAGKAVRLAAESKVKPVEGVYRGALVNVKKQYYVDVFEGAKKAHRFPLENFSEKSSRWLVADNMFVYVYQRNGSLVAQAWDFAGKKIMTNLTLPGFVAIIQLDKGYVWGENENIIITAKKNNNLKKIIIDVPSQSWKTE